MFRSILKMALSVVALFGLASAGNAAVVSLKLSEAGFADVIVNGSTSASFSGSYGTFIGDPTPLSGMPGVSVGAGIGQVTPGLLPATLFGAGAHINAATSAAGTLNIFATVQGLTDFLGTPVLQTIFQSYFVNQRNMANITEQAFIDPANGQFTTPISLGSLTFPAQTYAAPYADGPLSAPYSLTVEFTITAPAAALAGQQGWLLSAEIQAPAVPEPSTWAMMLLGFAGLGFAFGRSKRLQTS